MFGRSGQAGQHGCQILSELAGLFEVIQVGRETFPQACGGLAQVVQGSQRLFHIGPLAKRLVVACQRGAASAFLNQGVSIQCTLLGMAAPVAKEVECGTQAVELRRMACP